MASNVAFQANSHCKRVFQPSLGRTDLRRRNPTRLVRQQARKPIASSNCIKQLEVD